MSEDDKQVTSSNEIDRQDRFLERLVSSANLSKGEIAITVFVNGMMIDGFLTSYSKYMTDMNKSLSSALGVDTVLDEEYMNPDDEALKAIPRYLHIRQPNVRIPDVSLHFYGNSHSYLRFKISEITGFMLGSGNS